MLSHQSCHRQTFTRSAWGAAQAACYLARSAYRLIVTCMPVEVEAQNRGTLTLLHRKPQRTIEVLRWLQEHHMCPFQIRVHTVQPPSSHSGPTMVSTIKFPWKSALTTTTLAVISSMMGKTAKLLKSRS